MIILKEENYRTIVMRPEDSVAVALEEIPAETKLSVTFPDKKTKEIIVKETILFGHKFAIIPITGGSYIMKYGEVIGKALRDIEEGEHVHVHNLEGVRGRGDKIVGN
ncbi:UxaA family hydrolase [Metabacillus sp. BG109]|uniref:UxaA family hydrolase n=1 Tax=Metabacillus bambusae TaxID=2795218 RepID=A0ABS3MYU9_9BACI|nr:UxaA family hydrolase [Metabacillus bambusae]